VNTYRQASFQKDLTYDLTQLVKGNWVGRHGQARSTGQAHWQREEMQAEACETQAKIGEERAGWDHERSKGAVLADQANSTREAGVW